MCGKPTVRLACLGRRLGGEEIHLFISVPLGSSKFKPQISPSRTTQTFATYSISFSYDAVILRWICGVCSNMSSKTLSYLFCCCTGIKFLQNINNSFIFIIFLIFILTPVLLLFITSQPQPHAFKAQSQKYSQPTFRCTHYVSM